MHVWLCLERLSIYLTRELAPANLTGPQSKRRLVFSRVLIFSRRGRVPSASRPDQNEWRGRIDGLKTRTVTTANDRRETEPFFPCLDTCGRNMPYFFFLLLPRQAHYSKPSNIPMLTSNLGHFQHHPDAHLACCPRHAQHAIARFKPDTLINPAILH